MKRSFSGQLLAVTALVSVTLASAISSPLAAESGDYSAVVTPQVSSQTAKQSSLAGLAQFTPSADRADHRIDYAHWDEALNWLVIPMGPSVREGAPRVEATIGSRIIYGHQSRYRLEGNRVAFSFVDSKIRQSLTEYKQDLERVGTELDLVTLPRNEQLAFWLNLHNVAVIEAIAQAYPMRSPSHAKFGPDKVALDDAKLVTIKGVSLSPRDIREAIVYPNWRDPKVIYGFWRGEIGGPSIQRYAFTGENVDVLLSLGAEEFVNSLRGVESFNGALQVSRIYEEAMPFYFASDDDLRAHLLKNARDDVKELITEKDRTAFNRYDSDIADMVFGNGDPGYSVVCESRGELLLLDEQNCQFTGGTDRAAVRLMRERALKLFKAHRRGIRVGSVTIAGAEGVANEEIIKEVE